MNIPRAQDVSAYGFESHHLKTMVGNIRNKEKRRRKSQKGV